MVTRYIGECPICEGDYRLHKMLMVHHGYRRPGHGSIVGDCPGVDMQPWELSPDGTIWWVTGLRQQLVHTENFLDRLENGEVTELRVEEYAGGFGRGRDYKTITLTLADGYKFQVEVRNRISRARASIDSLTRDITRRQQRIDNWRQQPVRTEEEEMALKAQASAASRALRDEARAVRQAKRTALDAKQAERAQEKIDLLNEYRAIFNALALDGTPEALKEAKAQWIKMHKRKAKKGYLGFREPELGIDDALMALGLAAPNPRPYGIWQCVYSNDLGWDPRT